MWARFFSKYGQVRYVTVARDNAALLQAAHALWQAERRALAAGAFLPSGERTKGASAGAVPSLLRRLGLLRDAPYWTHRRRHLRRRVRTLCGVHESVGREGGDGDSSDDDMDGGEADASCLFFCCSRRRLECIGFHLFTCCASLGSDLQGYRGVRDKEEDGEGGG